MDYFILWTLGFSVLWSGLHLFDDEAVLIASVMSGSALILAGLITSPPDLQIVIEIVIVFALFNVRTKYIRRVNR